MDEKDSIKKLAKIFNSKNWFAKDPDESVFDSFCELMNILTPEERALVIELTDRYLWIPGKDYEDDIKEALKDVPNDLLEKAEKMFLFPIVKPGDDGKAKSGIGLAYDIKAMIPGLNRYRHLKVINIDDFDGFNASPGTREKELLVLVDDFIGSGDTLFQCLHEMERRMNVDLDKIIIVSISIQKEAYDILVGKGFRVFVKYQVPRSISDFNTGAAIKEKKDLMRLIENSIPGAKPYSLGWQESEATITLKRTPDNTFPIFWRRMKRNGSLYSAPFLCIRD
ncbi:phosphoribosyltransferase-like protein [Pedobacter panaciterrae]